MKKKIPAIMFSVALMAQALTGCGGAADETTPAPTDTTTAKAESAQEEKSAPESAGSSAGDVSLTVLCGYAGEDPHGKYVYQYADAYMEL